MIFYLEFSVLDGDAVLVALADDPVVIRAAGVHPLALCEVGADAPVGRGEQDLFMNCCWMSRACSGSDEIGEHIYQ